MNLMLDIFSFLVGNLCKCFLKIGLRSFCNEGNLSKEFVRAYTLIHQILIAGHLLVIVGNWIAPSGETHIEISSLI